jgi:hypothetical protein
MYDKYKFDKILLTIIIRKKIIYLLSLLSKFNLLEIYCSTLSFSFLYDSYFLCHEPIRLYWIIPVTKRIEDIIITADKNISNPNPKSLSASNILKKD